MILEDVEGQWGDVPSTSSVHAMTHLGGLLFLVRSSRPDLVFAVNFVARFASKWAVAADKRLKRIFEYLESTLHFGMRWQVHPASIQRLTVQVHVDADHAGCLETARSKSGWNVFVADGHGMCALVDWASRRQAATARSTGEAEVVAGADCVQSTFPIAAVLQEFVSQQLPSQLCTDSNSARTAFVNGYSRKLRYIKKNQRVCLGFVTDSLERTGGEAVRVDSGDNTADMHTKPLTRVAFTKLPSERDVVAICNGTM